MFLNPSTTDVVCTTTAEGLAMGKIVVCANHPSNEFFKQFPNCWTYDHSNGFVEATCKALDEVPVQLTDSQRHELSWEAASERFLKVSELDQVPTRKLSNIATKNFMLASFNFQRNMEDASVHMSIFWLLRLKHHEECLVQFRGACSQMKNNAKS